MRLDQTANALPPDRAFVVHFQTTARPRRRFEGRVEHLSSGRTAHFASRAALLAFFAALLAAPHRASGGTKGAASTIRPSHCPYRKGEER
jgi:hypothetical protein